MTKTTLCYLENDGKYLMLYRNKKKNDANGGKYIGIGGHLEENESPMDCAIREVREETGLILNSLEYRGIINFISDIYQSEVMYLFTSTDFEGEICECDEGELFWISKKELSSIPMWEGDTHFLKRISENSPFFEMTLEYKGDSLIHISKKLLRICCFARIVSCCLDTAG